MRFGTSFGNKNIDINTLKANHLKIKSSGTISGTFPIFFLQIVDKYSFLYNFVLFTKLRKL